MEYGVIAGIGIIGMIMLKFIFKISVKQIKEAGKNDKLDQLVKEKFPENIQIAKKLLKKLGNEKVQVKQAKEEKSETSLYLVMTDTIEIANISNSYTRIQTIAHECLHSVQDKTLLWFHFIISNIYLLYFALIIILTVFSVVTNKTLFLVILCLLSMIYGSIRSYLETNAMTGARWLAKEYMKEEDSISEEQIEEVVASYDRLNQIGIKAVNYQIVASSLLKISIYALVACIF